MHDGRFWNALGVTFTFAGLSIPFELLLGIGLAVLMNESFRGKGVARLAVLFPWALPTALNALMWRWMFNSGLRGLQRSRAAERIGRTADQLAGRALARHGRRWSFVSVWKTSSFMALIILAGLQAIPRDIYEAGRMDGMSRWQEFREITLPLLRAPILAALVIRSMDALQNLRAAFQSDRRRSGRRDGEPCRSTPTR